MSVQGRAEPYTHLRVLKHMYQLEHLLASEEQ